MEHIEIVRQMVKNYPSNQEEMKRLEREMENFKPVTSSEVLEMLTFPGRSDDHVHIKKQRSTNHLFYIATSYRKLTLIFNREVEKEMTRDFGKVAREVEFVRYAISALPRRYKDLMTYDILENHRWGEVCQKFNISGSELNRKKRRAIELMAQTFIDQHIYFGFYEEDYNNDDTRAV